MSDDLPQPEATNQKRGMIDLPHRFDRYEPLAEILATIILAFATLATAWSGYQSALWDGDQAAYYTQASALRLESARASDDAGQLTQVDIGLFTNWVNAYVEKNQPLTNFYQQKFRAEFRPAFEAWLATKPLENPDAPPSPFAMPEYVVSRKIEGQQLQDEAEAAFRTGEEANDISDRYVLNTVILASVLFLAGLATQVKSFSMRLVVVTLALLILAFGLYSVLILPIN